MVITYKAGNRLVGENKLYYKVHTFTSSGTFEITAGTGDVEYLVIAGGAGGGGSVNNTVGSAGGGAGGYRTATLSRGLGSYTVTVGAGGAGGGTSGANGTDGSDSVFDTITSDGGGGGGGSSGFTGSGEVGNTGGSGGGSGRLQSGAAGTSGQGYAGGDGTTGAYYAGGGGGGSAAVGSNAVSSAPGYGSGGAGGAGTSSSITGTAVIRAGGGGGGGHYAGGAAGSGGAGAGTNNSSGDDGLPATANTGSGGGGCSYNGNNSGGAGGSGIVIVKYHSSDINATGGTVTEIDDGSAAKPTADGTLVNNSTFTETDTGKEYILNYGQWTEKNQPSQSSIVELLGDHSEPLNQRMVECFLLRYPPYNTFVTVNVAGSGHTSVTQDAIDGGLRLTTSGSSGDRIALCIQDTPHAWVNTYSSEFIWVVKTDNHANSFTDAGISDTVNTSLSAGKSVYFRIQQANTNIYLSTNNGSVNTSTSTGVATDTNYHAYKGVCTSSAIDGFVDGIKRVTQTSNRPNESAAAPNMMVAATGATAVWGETNYCEVYNT